MLAIEKAKEERAVKQERSIKSGRQSDIERGMAALQASAPAPAPESPVTDIEDQVLLSDGTIDRTPLSSIPEPRRKKLKLTPAEPTAKYRSPRPPPTPPPAADDRPPSIAESIESKVDG